MRGLRWGVNDINVYLGYTGWFRVFTFRPSRRFQIAHLPGLSNYRPFPSVQDPCPQ